MRSILPERPPMRLSIVVVAALVLLAVWL